MADRQDPPLVGMERFHCPVELRRLLEQVVRERQVELGMTDLVEHPVDGDVPPAGRGSKAGKPPLHVHRHLLDHGDRAHVQHRRRLVAGVEAIEPPRPLECLLHGVRAGVFFPLYAHVLPIRGAKRLVPLLPRRRRDVAGARPLVGKRLLLVDVGKRPVEVSSQVVPLVTIHGLLPQPTPASAASASRAPRATAPSSPTLPNRASSVDPPAMSSSPSGRQAARWSRNAVRLSGRWSTAKRARARLHRADRCESASRFSRRSASTSSPCRRASAESPARNTASNAGLTTRFSATNASSQSRATKIRSMARRAPCQSRSRSHRSRSFLPNARSG